MAQHLPCSTINTKWISRGAALLALTVIIGAFGAHGLKSIREEYYISVYEKGVFYQFIHALGIMFVGILGSIGILSPQSTQRVCSLFLFGIIFFSGSLYLLAITRLSTFGAITPIGGISFIIAWAVLAIRIQKEQNTADISDKKY